MDIPRVGLHVDRRPGVPPPTWMTTPGDQRERQKRPLRGGASGHQDKNSPIMGAVCSSGAGAGKGKGRPKEAGGALGGKAAIKAPAPAAEAHTRRVSWDEEGEMERAKEAKAVPDGVSAGVTPPGSPPPSSYAYYAYVYIVNPLK